MRCERQSVGWRAGVGRRLTIYSARWTHPDSLNKTEWLSSQVVDGRLDVVANRDALGDPFRGVRKCLVIVYATGDGPPREAVYNEGERVRLG
jgi:hypothetical protein